jgi:hypothetical protein
LHPILCSWLSFSLFVTITLTLFFLFLFFLFFLQLSKIFFPDLARVKFAWWWLFHVGPLGLRLIQSA